MFLNGLRTSIYIFHIHVWMHVCMYVCMYVCAFGPWYEMLVNVNKLGNLINKSDLLSFGALL